MNDYTKTIKELYRLQQFSIKLGLENITSLCRMLDNPQMTYPTIHIAGTNGKGSTSFFLQKILMEYNLNVGLYTSPHLMDFRERIKVNDALIDKNSVNKIWNKIKASVVFLNATFFEATTAMAFHFFKQQKVSLAVIETGLGGRLDATNIINPVLAILTPVDIDHTKHLGSTLEKIALEKAGIIKKGITLFSASQHPKVMQILKQFKPVTGHMHCYEDIIEVANVKLFPSHSIFDFYDNMNCQRFKKVYLNTASRFQIDNALLAYLAARSYLKSLNIRFNQENLREALKKVHWYGRLDKVSSNPDIYFDVSHNVAGFKNTLNFIKKLFNNKSLYLLIGLLADKDYQTIVKLVSGIFKGIIVTEPDSKRALKAGKLKKEFLKYDRNVKIIKDLEKAYDFSVKNLAQEDKLFVMGSHFLVGVLLKKINKKS